MINNTNNLNAYPERESFLQDFVYFFCISINFATKFLLDIAIPAKN